LPYKLAQQLVFRKGFARIPSMLQRIFIASWSAAAQRAAMHPATSFPLTAGNMQGFPERVLAPQRGLDSIGPVLRRPIFSCCIFERSYSFTIQIADGGHCCLTGRWRLIPQSRVSVTS
jgi:hypothetical protein